MSLGDCSLYTPSKTFKVCKKKDNSYPLFAKGREVAASLRVGGRLGWKYSKLLIGVAQAH